MDFGSSAGALDYFSLFQLEAVFYIDQDMLQRNYQTLIKKFHPDQYAGLPEVEQRVAAQSCADINNGFRILSNEILRAEYLLKMSGVDLKHAEKRGVGPDFLMLQIALRERLDGMRADNHSQLDPLRVDVKELYDRSRDTFVQATLKADWAVASFSWLEMCYSDKLLSDVTRLSQRGDF